MSRRRKRIRAAIRMGLIWAAAWAPLGLLIGLVVGGNSYAPDAFPADDWIVPMTGLGFLGGAMFSALLRVASRRRTFGEIGHARVGAWGAVGGVWLGALAVAFWQLDAGFGPVHWPGAALVVSSASLMSALSATGSLALARLAKDRERPVLIARGRPRRPA